MSSSSASSADKANAHTYASHQNQARPNEQRNCTPPRPARVARSSHTTHSGSTGTTKGACPDGWAAAGKHLATAVLAEVADEALQLSGGDGYRRGHPADRAVRDATGLALAGGTTETHAPTA
ncbi:acyl-CoA dehydrogenase family protein [Micromonospora taraxaci]|uniref:acyl-CoA dehydrogenase family protein n=1 Tax=Micromonospora taraxaci TaxID=1316803 RepID=UPI0034080041